MLPHSLRSIRRASTLMEYGRGMSTSARKAGVATDAEFAGWIDRNGIEDVVVVDARNTNFEIEPGDAKYKDNIAQQAGVHRPRAVNLPYDRVNKNMDLTPLEHLLVKGKDTPIVTHCGGGGRGQKAKIFLEKLGYTNVINGGGPKEKSLWKIFGSL